MEPLTNITHPKPTDFDKFLPWACKEFSVDTDVVVNRVAQTMYVSAARHKKQSHKGVMKPSKSHPSLAKDIKSTEDINSSLNDSSSSMTISEVRLTIQTVYDINENLVQLKFLKNKTIPRKVMQTIALTIPFQRHLTSIIIDSGLRMDSLYEISKFLPNSNITELCLDGTFLSQANYYILLMDSKIQHLSLAKCTLNDAVVKTIADQLKTPCPASKVLSALNLSSNRITDVGAKYLADMLRTNRQLSYLNLAGNMITDEGCMNILDILHEFPLQTQELLDGRRRYVAYLKKRNGLINSLTRDLQTAEFGKSPKKKFSKKVKLESQSRQYISLEKPEAGTDAQIIQERAECFADIDLGVFNEPFSQNNTTTHDYVVYCHGNYSLCYLNFAYNNLTYASVKKLHEVLSTQKSRSRTPRGLIKVVIEGNLMPVACKEYEEIDRLLRSGLDDSKRQSEAATKRKSLSSKNTSK